MTEEVLEYWKCRKTDEGSERCSTQKDEGERKQLAGKRGVWPSTLNFGRLTFG